MQIPSPNPEGGLNKTVYDGGGAGLKVPVSHVPSQPPGTVCTLAMEDHWKEPPKLVHYTHCRQVFCGTLRERHSAAHGHTHLGNGAFLHSCKVLF